MTTTSLQQRDITRLCIHCALLLLQYGAETMLVERLSQRLGLALGADSVESAISSNAIVLTTIKEGHCLTSTRKSVDRGINMSVVTAVQHTVILAEHHLLDIVGVEKRLGSIKATHYPLPVMMLAVGLSCGCFCRLNGGDWDGSVVAFIASAIAIFVRVQLAKRHINPVINVCITAFVATSISGSLITLPIFQQTSTIAMAASILLLVPGFPLINAVADIFKGHVNVGVARWTIASLLALSTCIGVVLAMLIWGLKGWL